MNNNAHAPIGLFDSGIGGLTVANAILEQLPNESLIYFGDTAHLPYGDNQQILSGILLKRLVLFCYRKNAR